MSYRDSYTSFSSYSSLPLPEHKRVDDFIQGLIHLLLFILLFAVA
jgi:hypothetical protein